MSFFKQRDTERERLRDQIRNLLSSVSYMREQVALAEWKFIHARAETLRDVRDEIQHGREFTSAEETLDLLEEWIEDGIAKSSRGSETAQPR